MSFIPAILTIVGSSSPLNVGTLFRNAVCSDCRIKPRLIIMVWNLERSIAHSLTSMAAVTVAVLLQLYNIASSPKTFPIDEDVMVCKLICIYYSTTKNTIKFGIFILWLSITWWHDTQDFSFPWNFKFSFLINVYHVSIITFLYNKKYTWNSCSMCVFLFIKTKWNWIKVLTFIITEPLDSFVECITSMISLICPERWY